MSKYSYENTKPKEFPQGMETDQVKIEAILKGDNITSLKVTLKKSGVVKEFPIKGGLEDLETFLEKKLVFDKIRGKNKSKKMS